ncbi:MAG: hypothetical protein GY749_18435 [Desulfobacteraceae bacterium]|nr:hypothetical protein [Desulfobacteraceae bacterium]
MNKKHSELNYFFILFFLFSASCAVKQPVCTKDDTTYCRTRGNFTGQWYDHYERALSCMEGECFDAAISDLDESVKTRDQDQRKARTLSMHFIDYFPHREKGLIHYLEGRYEEAKTELELSIKYYPSAKALFYLDEVRKKIMETERQSPTKPDLLIVFPELSEDSTWTRDDPVIISGVANDEHQYISEIILAGNPVFIEASSKSVEFTENLELDQGRHEIDIIARNLLGGETDRRIVINVDRTGPVIILKKFAPGVSVIGYLYDESGEISLLVNDKPVKIPKGEDVEFNVTLGPDAQHVTLLAKDKLGNETITNVTEAMSIKTSPSPMLVQNSSGAVVDTGRVFSVLSGKAHGPEIILKGWSDHETVFKKSVNFQVEVKSRNNIEKISINDKPRVIHRSGKIVSFNYFARLKQGKNTFTITALDESGRTSIKNIGITRKIPEAFQLKNRYSLTMNPFDSAGGKPGQVMFQYHFLEDIISRNRFQISARKELEAILDHEGFSLSRKSNADTIDSVLLGVIYDTKNGIEIAARLVDVESRETLATADVYDDHKHNLSFASMAKKLSEKLHRALPIMDGSITRILENRVVVTPEKWIPVKGKVIKPWPLILYREKTPKDRVRGSDTEIICNGGVDAFDGKELKAFVQDCSQDNIRLRDKVVSR